jgi:hypothetical protein
VVVFVDAAGVELVCFAEGFVDDGAAAFDVEVFFAAAFGATVVAAVVGAALTA